MPDWLTTQRARPWHHAGHRVLRPFSDPERVGGERYEAPWCRHCRLYGTGQKEGRFEGCVYAMKEWCRRCGRVITYAIYNQSGDAAAAERARTWVTTPEEVT